MSERPAAVFSARRVLRNRRLLALAASPLLLYVPLLIELLSGTYGQLVLLFHPALLAAVSMFEVARRNPRPRLVAGELTVGPTSLRLPDGEELARSAIEQGFVSASDTGEARVTLFGPRIPIELVLENEDAGRQLLAALGLDATQTAVSFSGQSRVATLPMSARIAGLLALWTPAVATLLLALTRVGGTPSERMTGLVCMFVGMVLIFAPLGPLALLSRPSRIAVGIDGIEILWLGRRRFVPFARVTSVGLLAADLGSKASRGVLVTLDDGEQVPLPLPLSSLVEGEAKRLAARIEQAIAARNARPSGAAQQPSRLLDPAQMVTSLRRAGAGAAAGPRSAATDPELLLATLEDPGATASARAGAAISLSASGDNDSRARILSASRQVASPRLRIALERAAEPDIEEAALVEALAAVAEEEQASLARKR